MDQVTAPHPINLTDEEEQLCSRIDFGSPQGVGNLDSIRKSLAPAHDLTIRLLRRGAIPAIRIRYFRDPELNIGGYRKSREQIFEKNGTAGEEIFRHPHFLKHLHYFIVGPDLPAETISSFTELVKSSQPVTSGDQAKLSEFAKRETRKRQLNRKSAAEEFFKLALEVGLDSYDARMIRDSVLRLRNLS